MKFKTLSVFVLALLLAGGAAWFANRWIQLQVTPVSAGGNPTAFIVVAAQTIPMGRKIVDTHLELAAWPADRIPGDTFNQIEEIKGHVALQTIYEGEAILKKRIAKHAKGSTLSAIIAKNKRAVTVRVNDVIGVAGFVLPGNFVDVLETAKKRSGNVTVKTVLQNVKVLAVDQVTGDKDAPVVVRAVTLELDPEQAEDLVKANSRGKIQLALRNSLDTDIYQPLKKAVPLAKPKRKPQKRRRYITIIRGTTVNESPN